MSQFSAALRQLIHKSGKTKTAIARELNVTNPTMSGWYSGRTTPELFMRLRIFNYFQDISVVDDFFTTHELELMALANKAAALV